MPRQLPHIEAAKDEATRLGAAFIFERRSKHACYLLKINGKQRKMFLSISPGDKKLDCVVREEVRRKIKEMLV